ncbi:hypothetical protein LJC18_02910 [Lachnospiraceae bacterium OttesenSCG-928-E19]|nr:hypothetical protein [Lachnospiraceae bacterium OttesenSCG-928-E19]
MAALLLVGQVGLAFLPNIEVVSLLIIIYTLVFEKRTLYIIYVFALLEGMMYGFGIWWIMYLYVWTILYLIVRVCRKNESVMLWAILSAFFGLGFGALCAVPYAVAGGIGAGIAWWGAGILFDVIHGIGNFFVVLVLFKPVYYVVSKMNGAQTVEKA